ncbi:PGPGW domain-containing protein [Aeromicrobium sp. Sec7.5]|uniref:PGPGW domain-containing protein n=1 Tax=Aeromicrobium sp. Sec7.5 TaxID=3121276 RepID=UPI002FE489E2
MSESRTRRSRSAHAARRIAATILGWLLVLAGIAALVLPGPGLLLLAAGLAVLSQQYEWAERRLEPVKVVAFKTAADGVQTWPRILASVSGALVLGALGVVWGLRPDAPEAWPLADRYWLIGGWGTGATLILSALIALAIIVYSFRRFRGVEDPESAAEQSVRKD